MRKRRRSRESIERLRRQRVADLKHLLRCCRAGLLPEVNCATVESVLRDEANLPPMDELGARGAHKQAARGAQALDNPARRYDRRAAPRAPQAERPREEAARTP